MERCGLCLIVTSAIVRIMPFAKMRYLYWLQIHIFRGNHGTKHTIPTRAGEIGWNMKLPYHFFKKRANSYPWTPFFSIRGPFIKDVFNFLRFLAPLRHHFYKISLLSKIIFWQTPLPLNWWHLLWTAPKKKFKFTLDMFLFDVLFNSYVLI